MKDTKVVKYMTKTPTSVVASDPLKTAWSILEKESFNHLPVVDDKAKVVGMISRTDIENFKKIFSYMDSEKKTLLDNLTNLDVMSNPVKTIEQNQTMQEANDVMLSERIRALVVLQGTDNVVGIISETDILHFYNELYNTASQ